VKNSNAGTEPSRGFAVEQGTTWRRWAKRRSDAELAEITHRLPKLQENFGKPHLHAGLGLRRLSKSFFEFRISRDLRVVFAWIKPNTLRLAMCGNHDEVHAWIKENS
jgi:hypothetical protein